MNHAQRAPPMTQAKCTREMLSMCCGCGRDRLDVGRSCYVKVLDVMCVEAFRQSDRLFRRLPGVSECNRDGKTFCFFLSPHCADCLLACLRRRLYGTITEGVDSHSDSCCPAACVRALE